MKLSRMCCVMSVFSVVVKWLGFKKYCAGESGIFYFILMLISFSQSLHTGDRSAKGYLSMNNYDEILPW